MPVHIYGTAADMDTVMQFAGRHGLLVIEDAAQAIGVRYKGRHAGTIGHVGIFSFFADKTVTTGEGGFVMTNDPAIHERLLYLRNQGRRDRGTFIHTHIGYNLRMTDIQCAVGLAQLDKLEEIVLRKKAVLEKFREFLGGLPQIRFFEPEPGADLIPFRVSVLCERAHELMEFLRTRDIEPRSFFYPLHRQPAFEWLKSAPDYSHSMADGDFPNAIYGYERGVMLPCFPTITEHEIAYVCDAIRRFYGS
jgi:perosamine synthetase